MQGLHWSRNWNEHDSNPLTRNNWRASLVPAAAVIPAPIAYIKVVAVKKLVVELWSGAGEGFASFRSERRRSAPDGRALVSALPPTGRSLLLLIEWEYSPGPRKAAGQLERAWASLRGSTPRVLREVGFRRGNSPFPDSKPRQSSGSFTLNKLECS